MTKSKKDKGTGYKKPPKETQWKKGQSGNPKGRPKKSDKIPDEDKNFWKIFEEEMKELITVNTPEGPQKISTKRALIKRLIEKSIKDKDSRSINKILQIFEKLDDIEDANEDYEPVIIEYHTYPDDENSNRRASDIIE